MCGIVGIIGTPHAAKESYLGLLMLQHRGQDSAGIISFQNNSKSFHYEKNLGHIKEALPEDCLKYLKGETAIAHTRYSTIGKIRKEEVQPMLMNYPYGLAMAHNGNLVNSETIKKELLEKNRRISLSHNDLEVMMNLLADKLAQTENDLTFEIIIQAVQTINNKLKGGFSSVTIIADHGLLAFKDSKAIRPLVWGRRKLTTEEKEFSKNDFAYAVASESKSLEFLGYENINELKQGELLFITKEGKIYQHQLEPKEARPCMFEWIYFANADSTIWNQNVYQTRLNLGKILGEQILNDNEDFDIVVPVPDTSRPSAITLSEKLKIPYREVLIKNRYAQRTFILNSQKDREKAVQLKMSVVKEEINGKHVLLVDDSIVRGTTSKRIIKVLKDAGARKVSIISTCPPIKHPCFYGIDFPSKEELIAHDKGFHDIAIAIGAHKVIYPTRENFLKAFKKFKTCDACISGDYPIDISTRDNLIESRIRDEESDIPRISKEHIYP